MTDHLVLMSGHPQASGSLPRLVPVLGDRGTARLQRRLLEHVTDTARRWRDSGPDRRVTVACQGASAGEFREWLGPDLDYEGDSGGSPGARRAVASVRAFTRGADRVVLAGVQCPTLDHVLLDTAFFALDHVDCVVGPGHAGRYYLVGLVAPAPYLFAGLPWGTGAVLARTLSAARDHHLRVGRLQTLPMVHGPGDLVHAAHLIAEPVDLGDEVRVPPGAPEAQASAAQAPEAQAPEAQASEAQASEAHAPAASPSTARPAQPAAPTAPTDQTSSS
jgi:hypothetical protein